ncbi:hypothetical protein [Ensifer aridi]|uniref:hypothetical protein n=1 Tax=Ensifer aridi TaxID=1708715 RepID=UPI00040981D0|nr:hypothetical protein [Ensifer aridi]
MKFVLLCDLVRAPASVNPVVGMRLSGAALRPDPGEPEDAVLAAARILFDDVDGDALPAPDDASFSTYLDRLARGAGPLFPWIGGELQFAALWASVDPGADADPTIDPLGITTSHIALPDGTVGGVDFEMTDSVLGSLRHAALADLVSDRPGRTNNFTELRPFILGGLDDGNSKTPIDEVAGDTVTFRYEAFMAGLASMPAPIPHGRLNLVRFCKLTAVKPTPSQPTEHVLMVVAPRLTLRDGTALAPDLAATTWTRLESSFVATVPYPGGFGGHPVEAICRAIDLSAPPSSTNSFINLDTLWVRRKHTAEPDDPRTGIGFDDWLGRLPARTSEVFDLPQRLLDALQNDIKAPGAPLTSAIAAGDRKDGAGRLTRAVLVALRDIVGPGVVVRDDGTHVEGPNGAPAHRALVEQVNGAVRGTPLDGAQTERLVAAIEAGDKAFRDAFRPGGTGAEDRLAEWYGVLAGAIGPSLGLPDSGAEFAPAIAHAVAGMPGLAAAYDPTMLRRVVDAAVGPAGAAGIQVANWHRAIAGDPDFGPWLSAATDAFLWLSEHGFDPVGRLRKANIDLPWIHKEGIWRRVASGPTRDIDFLRGTETEKGSIRDAISAYVLGTLCEASGIPAALEDAYAANYGRVGNLPAGARLAVAEAIDVVVKTRVKSSFTDPDRDPDGQTLLTGPLVADAHPVALQIDRLVVSQSSGWDFNEDLAGYGMLMRRSDRAAESWCCLTASFAEIDPDALLTGTPSAVEFKAAPRTVLGAVPVGYVGNAPQGVISYDNRPVIGDGQDDAMTDPQEAPPPDPRILRLLQPVTQERPPAETLLPFLAYGATYEIAPFGISNQGALPEAIRRNDYPALLDPGKLTPGHFAPGADILRRFTYLRCTGVGALRVEAIPLPDGRSYHPMTPGKETKPLAEEILVPPEAVEPWRPAPSPPALRPLKLKTALLLADENGGELDDGCSTLRLRISPPVTPIEDFDRWLAFDESLKTDVSERQALREFRKKLRDRQADLTLELNACAARLREASGAEAEALAARIRTIEDLLVIQDPAVDALAVSVRRVRRDGALASEATASFDPFFLPWEWTWNSSVAAEDPFASRPPIELVCKIGPKSAPIFDKTGRTVTLAAGDIVVVQVFAAVLRKKFSDPVWPGGIRRFDKAVREASVGNIAEADLPVDEHGNGYRLFSLHAFTLEAASPAMPSEQELAAAITSHVVGTMPAEHEHEGDVRLDFTRRPGLAMDAVGSITVGTQAWRWTGRPLPPFPFKKHDEFNHFPTHDPGDPHDRDPTKRIPPPSPSDYPLLWDVAGFAERLDETLGDPTVAIAISEKRDEAGDMIVLPVRIALNSPRRKETARYLRFQATARSRYAAAYALAGKALPSVVPASWENATGQWKTRWHRVLRPASDPADVPKPSIRAVLPLTRALREREALSAVSGVLAIADGAWFEHAGLADWMIGGAEIAYRRKIHDPGTGSAGPARAVEFGPDPLVRTYGLANHTAFQKRSPENVEQLRGVAPLSIAGPLGHGFDTGTATGLFLNSSFVVRPPAFAEHDPDAWWMGKLAFRRLVLAEAMDDYWNSVAASVSSTVGQVSLTQHAIAATAETATATITVEARLEGIDDPVSLKVEAERANGVWTLLFDGAQNEPVALRSTAFDLRMIAVRQRSIVDPAATAVLHYAWFDVLLLVREGEGHWFLAWQTRWFDAPSVADTAENELKVSMQITPSGAAIGPLLASRAVQVSEPTEGRWAQFLPNMDVLGRLSKIPVGSLDLRFDEKTPGRLLLAAGKGWLSTNGLLTERSAGKENQRLFSLLLLTAGISSVSGGEDEIFVGLYHSPDGHDAGLSAVPLEPFETGFLPVLPLSGPLIGRILTVRASNPLVREETIALWRSDPWQQFFPREQGDSTDPGEVFGAQKATNADLQIIEIYAPIRLQGRS